MLVASARAWTIAAHSAGFGRMRDQSTGTSR
jgi:hypothetical protein